MKTCLKALKALKSGLLGAWLGLTTLGTIMFVIVAPFLDLEKLTKKYK